MHRKTVVCRIRTRPYVHNWLIVFTSYVGLMLFTAMYWRFNISVFGTVIGELWRSVACVGLILRLNWGRLRSRTDAEKGENVICMYVHCIYLLLYTIWALSTVTASLTYGAVNQCYEYAWTVPAVYVKDTWPTRQTWVHSILAGPYTQSDPNSNPNIIQSMDRVSPIHVQL